MAFYINRGTTAYNPRAVTEGLIFYVDPNNARCRTPNEDRFVSLIQPFSNIADLSAGTLTSNTKSLTSIGGNYFIELSGSNFLAGNIGPDYALSGLDNFTLQFWFKNNKPVNRYTNIFSNADTTIPLLSATGLTITLSTNYPYSEEFGTQGINGQYHRLITPTQGRVVYQRRFPDNTTTRPFRIVWSGSKWFISNGSFGDQAIHFESNEDEVNPVLAQNWNFVLTSFKFDTGDIPVEFFNTIARPGLTNNDSKIQYNFYPILSSNTGNSNYLQKPIAVGASTTLPSVQRLNYNEPWTLRLLGYDYDGTTFVADSLAEYPWQPITYSPKITALSAGSDIYINNILTGSKQPLSGWYFYYREDYNDRPVYWRSDINPLTLQISEIYMYYFTPSDDPQLDVPGWYIVWYDAASTSYILSSDSSTNNPWEIENWGPTNDRTYTSLTTSFSSIFYNIPSITAVPIYPEELSNITLTLSADLSPVTERPGLFLSGSNNFLSFSYSNNDGFLPLKRTLFETNTANWYCITLAQSGKHVTLYKNSTKQTVSNLSTKYFNLSSLFFGNDVTIGQILLYNKHLSPFEIRQNYNSFRSRYRSSETIKLPPPVTYILVTGAGLSWVNGIYTERGLYNGKKYYNLINSPDIGLNTAAITWVADLEKWVIWDINGDIIYTSSEDVEFPWETTTWIDFTNEYPPPPKLIPRFEPVPLQTFRKYSYGRWFNGLTENFVENYPSYQIKLGSSWPPDLQSLKLYCNYINVGGIQYDFEDYIFEAFEPDGLGYDDLGFGFGFLSYINALNSLLESYVGGIELFPAVSNLIVADFTATTPDFEILLTDEYNSSSGSYNQFYIIKKENNEITDAISNNFEGLTVNWLE